jgi:hypothetical protein
LCEKCDTRVKVGANGGKNLVYHQAGKGCRENLRKAKERKTQEKSKAYPIADMADNEPEANATGRLPQRRTRTKRYVSDLHVCNCGEAVADGDESIIECNRAGCETRKVSHIIDTKFNALTNGFYNLVPPNLRKPRVCRSWVDL